MGQGPGIGPRLPLAMVIGASGHEVPAQEYLSELLVSSLPRWRTYVLPIDLYPRMGDRVLRLQRKADHQVGGITLVAQQDVQHESRPQASRPPRAESQYAGNDAPEPAGLEAVTGGRARHAQPRDRSRERMAGRRPPNPNEGHPDPERTIAPGREAPDGVARDASRETRRHDPIDHGGELFEGQTTVEVPDRHRGGEIDDGLEAFRP